MNESKRTALIITLSIIIFLLITIATVLFIKLGNNNNNNNNTNIQKDLLISQPISNSIANEAYAVKINPLDFVPKITNKFLTLTPGKRFIYKGKVKEGVETVEVYVTHDTKKVMGVTTTVVWDRVWLNDELIEDTKDWFSQDKYGNVWYFGEESKEIVNGNVVSREGSWEAGVDGALPGIVMKANPKAGDVYRQEYYKNEAEDIVEVLGIGAKVKVPYGTFDGCLQTKDWTPLEKNSDEHKYYCPDVGNVVLEVGLKDNEKVYLIEVMANAKPTPSSKAKNKPLENNKPIVAIRKNITEQDAIRIAKERVDGDVTEVSIENKYGKAAYVVEIDDDGEETDVIIDIETGNVLGIER